jgi:hypothetical protein
MIIKYNEKEIAHSVALDYVNSVMRGGLVSSTGKQKHYCHVSVFSGGWVVYASITKSGTHVFNVTKEK